MTTDPPSVRVLAAVADREGLDPTELTDPLYRAVDPDALDHLFRGTETGAGRVVFEYHGYEVTVCGSGDVNVVRVE